MLYMKRETFQDERFSFTFLCFAILNPIASTVILYMARCAVVTEHTFVCVLMFSVLTKLDPFNMMAVGELTEKFKRMTSKL